MNSIPSYQPDIFDDDAQLDPYGHYQALRDLGPVVWLEPYKMYALPRYAEVRAALGDPETFCSGRGVAMDDLPEGLPVSTLMSDGALHEHLRSVLTGELTPRALRPRKAGIQDVADEVVEQLVRRRSFDGVADLARALPLAVVPDLVGWPQSGREHLLEWAAGAFNLLGPFNERSMASLPAVGAMTEFAIQTADSGDLLPGSVGAGMLAAAARGEIEPGHVPSLLVDYIAPSLDTTISAIGSALWLLGTHPDQWAALRADRTLIPKAVNEAIRFETPIRSFTRVTTTATEVGGFEIPADARVMMMYACANRDERHYERPDEFDITREASDHLGFGYGVHGCAGQGLARLEAQAVLSALADQVESFEIGEPVRGINNIIRALAALPMTVTPARATADA
ncbi:cytochrome P450 [Streptomyces sp. NBC_00028]|uniref:cytochrome P450 n=1 Tax=Streptomyces sp. NBC_00028 TaxID=2975624 RepID=UPI003246039D